MRHSGSEMFFIPASNNGAKIGINGATSTGFFTNLAMFSVMTAHFLLMAVFLSLKPRFNSGTVNDRAEAVTVCTKVVPASAYTMSGTNSGSAMASTVDPSDRKRKKKNTCQNNSKSKYMLSKQSK